MLKNIEKYIESINLNKTNPDFNLYYQLVLNKFYSDSDSSIHKINFVFYDKFGIEPSVYLGTKLLCEEREGQTKFRSELIKFYSCCIISGDDPNQCQACHIIPYSDTKLNHVSNGLLLNYNLHHLFDSFLLAFKFIENFDDIFDNYQIVLNTSIKTKQTYKNYHMYEDKIVKISVRSRDFLDENFKQFLNI